MGFAGSARTASTVLRSRKLEHPNTGRYQVGRDGCLPIGCFSETDVTRLAVMDAPHRMLPETGRYQVVAGMDAPSMFLRTGRDQVGSDGCSPYRMLLEKLHYQVLAGDARPMGAHPIGCF